jgi:hypothetical protein
MGASEVHLYLDRANPEAEAVLSKTAGVRLTVCDENYWGKDGRKKRPDYHIGRQSFNANDHYRTCTTDWAVFCDVDEFVCPSRPLSDILAEVPQDIEFFRIPVAERVFQSGKAADSIFDGVFRLSLEDREEVERQVYGWNAKYLFRGVLGHNLGKTIARTRRNLSLTPHFALPSGHPSSDRSFLEWPEYSRFIEGVYLAHLDAITPTQWLFKLMKKYVNIAAVSPDPTKIKMPALPKSRVAQINSAFRNRQDKHALAEMKKVLVLDDKVVGLLRKFDGLADIHLDVVNHVARYFPDLDCAYSVEAFDSRLRAENAALIHDTGFAG